MTTLVEIFKKVEAVDFAGLKKRAVKNFDLDKVPTANVDNLVYAAVHCCINGPVGVGKKTSWPGKEALEGQCIKDIAGVPFSNSQWKGFCQQIANHLEAKCPEQVEGCYTKAHFKQLWPTCGDAFVAKVKT